MKISGSTVVVTGAASGLGAVTAAHFSRRGAHVLGFDLEASLPKTGSSPGITYVPVDVTDPVAIAQGLDEAAAASAPMRVLVNCAGIAPSARILSSHGTHDLDLFAKVVQINLMGTFNVMTLAAERIAASELTEEGERGVIINTASIAGYEGQIGQAAYASSKAGVIGLTIAAARDLAQHGVRVNTIAPGVVETPMLAMVSDDYRNALAAGVTFPQRLGRPEEYARLAAFLVEHQYMNGEVVRMDGALRMAPK
ncbi:SDR family NAD(P)-dependent oxidoreductase [Marmoricola sp. RAF53]|uniref:SDR family NAD(P)-dependent oxidoreductase n=1 Tax=Marmoricola sp. RAF53 TaxID=3233059 RepID=UPI003F9DE1C2